MRDKIVLRGNYFKRALRVAVQAYSALAFTLHAGSSKQSALAKTPKTIFFIGELAFRLNVFGTTLPNLSHNIDADIDIKCLL